MENNAWSPSGIGVDIVESDVPRNRFNSEGSVKEAHYLSDNNERQIMTHAFVPRLHRLSSVRLPDQESEATSSDGHHKLASCRPVLFRKDTQLWDMLLCMFTFGLWASIGGRYRRRLRFRYITSVISASHFEVYTEGPRCLVFQDVTPVLRMAVEDVHVQRRFGMEYFGSVAELIGFDIHFTRYVYNYSTRHFEHLKYNTRVEGSDVHETFGSGISDSVATERSLLYGACEMYVPITPLWKLCIAEITQPFFLFQFFSLVVWFFEEYYQYAVAILLITTVSMASELINTNQNQRRVRQIATHNDDVFVYRTPFNLQPRRHKPSNPISSTGTTTVGYERWLMDVKRRVIPSRDLVPGDLFEITPDMTLPCDAMLLSGSVIVSEAILNGESAPVVKEAITPNLTPDIPYDPNEHVKHTLYAGSTIIHITSPEAETIATVALVVRTGFETSLGGMMKLVLEKTDDDHILNLTDDTKYFLGCLAIIACLGSVYTLYIASQFNFTWGRTLVRCFDLFTDAIPPSLPAALTAGVSFATYHLSRLYNVTCLIPGRLSSAGCSRHFIFDKTGTLTSDEFQLVGVVPAPLDVPNRVMEDNVMPLEMCPRIDECIAVCHSVVKLDGELVGDLLETALLEYSKWSLVSSHEFMSNTGRVLKVIRRFDFTPQVQRMSVVVACPYDRRILYCKGAPERVMALCIPSSVPSEAHEVLAQHSRRGMRVLSVAYRVLEEDYEDLGRDVESDMIFLGLVLIQNAVRPNSGPSVRHLRNASCESYMATGDGPWTALSVSREVGIIQSRSDHILMGDIVDGDVSWKCLHFKDGKLPIIAQHATLKEAIHHPVVPPDSILIITGAAMMVIASEYLNRRLPHRIDPLDEHIPLKDVDCLELLVDRCRVYCRMFPDAKACLVNVLRTVTKRRQSCGMAPPGPVIIGMCGDGANDCGALKSADVGVSLSDAEASLAAPFNATEGSVEACVHVLREGRSSLVASLRTFQFTVATSAVQTLTVMCLYYFGTNFADAQYLWCDLGLALPLAILMSRTFASEQLTSKIPPTSILEWTVTGSLIGHVLIDALFQVFALVTLTFDPAYVTEHTDVGKISSLGGLENAVAFGMASMQYTVLGIIYSDGRPWRKNPWTSNFPLTVWVVLSVLLSCSFLIGSSNVPIVKYLIYWLDLRYLSHGTRIWIFTLAVLNALSCFCYERMLHCYT